jgi:hypothetical protein
MDRVKGYNLVPLPPAKIMPFILFPPAVFIYEQKVNSPKLLYVQSSNRLPQERTRMINKKV